MNKVALDGQSHKDKPKHEFPCTECGGDAFIGYGGSKKDSWQGLVKAGERLCTACFQKRGGVNFFQKGN